MRSFLFAVMMLALAGCPDRSLSSVTPQQGGAVIKKIPVSADIDVLFVIDNSASTQDKQAVFAQNFPRFVAALDAFPTGRPNLHIGVIDTTVDIGAQGYSTGGGAGCPSPDPGDNGLLQNTARMAGCTAPNGRYLVDIKTSGTTRQTNYSGTLDQALSCIALVGTSGCGFEAQLEAMKRALDSSNTANAGFVRDGAYLAVIFLTDEDDASTKDSSVFSLNDMNVGGHNDFRVQPLFAYNCDTAISNSAPGTYSNCKARTDSYLQDPAYYASFLSSVKDPAQIVVAVIAAPPPGLSTNDNPPQTANSMTDITTGPLTLNNNTQPLALEPSCTATTNGNPQVGRPAIRLASFLGNFGSRGRFYSICQSDYSAALTDIGQTLFNAISPCLEGPVDPTDVDPSNPGTQLDCDVNDSTGDGSAATLSPIVKCPMQDATTPTSGGPRPCYWIDQNTTTCPSPDTGYELNIVRAQPPAPGTNVDVECAVATK